MSPVFEAVLDQDAQTAAREGAKLELLITDMRDALARAPEYPPAQRFETRLNATMDLFLEGVALSEEGLETSDESKLLEAIGIFEAGTEIFGEARSEYQSLDFCG